MIGLNVRGKLHSILDPPCDGSCSAAQLELALTGLVAFVADVEGILQILAPGALHRGETRNANRQRHDVVLAAVMMMVRIFGTHDFEYRQREYPDFLSA